MLGRLGNIVLGFFLFFLGVSSVVLFFEPIVFDFGFVFEILVVVASVFFLSSLYYGRLGFVSLFLAGVILGGSFFTAPFFVVFGVVPCLVALVGGVELGNNVLLDLKGERNLFDGWEKHLFKLVLALVLGFFGAYFLSGSGLESFWSFFGADPGFLNDLKGFLSEYGGLEF